jgi:ribose transport system ATP-binding protein
MLKNFTGIEINPDTLVKNLPLSVKQWIVIARSLIVSPKILILDESSASLDLDATDRLHQEIRKLRNQGCCILVVTHRIAELVRIADHATILRDGSVVGELSGNEITAKNIMGLISSKSNKIEENQKNKSNSKKIQNKIVLQGRKIIVTNGSNDFDFKLKSGEIIGVTGLDGQGQVNFINAVAGIKPPLKGDIYSGTPDSKNKIKNFSDAEKNGVAYVSGDRANEGIFPNLSIFENFSLALYRIFLNNLVGSN